MLTPQFVLPIAGELVVDLFAGGGGASTGIEQAIGRHVDIAVNHDPEAVSLHTVNHPQTRHYTCDVFEVDPLEVTGGQAIGLLWASPDCKHFSKAKGGKPVSKKIRALANVIAEWAEKVRPRVICMENVEEFKTWGPLDEDNYPIPERAGELFREWCARIEAQGYVGEFRELRAADYETPTIRKRLFGIFRCDGQPIVWPEATHGKPGTLPVQAKKLKPWRSAAECIDWSVPCPSIFERKRPLAEATLRRIAKGVMRYVVDCAEPFIVPLTHQGGDRTEDIRAPFNTVTSANRGEKALIVSTLAPFLTEHANASTQRTFSADVPLRTQCAQVKGGHFALVAPTLVQTGYGERAGQAPRALDLQAPLGTVVSGQKHALVAAFLAQHNNHRGTVPSDGRAATEPLSTITTKGAQQTIVAANLVHMGHGEGKDGKKRFSHGVRDATEPLNTVTASGMPAALVTTHLMVNTTGHSGAAADSPLPTITTGGHMAEVRAFLIKYYGTDQDPQLREPLHTVTTKDRFGLVTVHGEEYAIVDIGLRMLTPRELYRAQGFPDTYIIDHGAAGESMTKTAQVRMCGNSVCPPLARAIVAANFRGIEQERAAA
ncbi:DNA cytosine methyltransferase [Variovorax paradoxus]|uniref:DNA cytosine methyltransferase n=1 Tax=Variovorax paradoxus TaxID=34073 RepID=UPI0024801335|nr:DNA cytosine methyltransferase [Variovorax paradoxus]WGT64967.1 DNA cytosine methyltransferase [Variovorax paradoxus]